MSAFGPLRRLADFCWRLYLTQSLLARTSCSRSASALAVTIAQRRCHAIPIGVQPPKAAIASYGMGAVSCHDAWQWTNYWSDGARRVFVTSSMLAIENEKANVMRNWFQAVMDPSRNPLAKLRPAQRFQIMATLAIMWSLIFCAMAGIMVWYPAYVAAHLVLLAIGTLVTAVVFKSAAKQ